MSMTKTSKLLLYLRKEPSHLTDIAMYLYGIDYRKSRLNAESIITNSIRLGWDIRKQGQRYFLGEEHYKLIYRDKARAIIRWDRNCKMTPENVSKEISRIAAVNKGRLQVIHFPPICNPIW